MLKKIIAVIRTVFLYLSSERGIAAAMQDEHTAELQDTRIATVSGCFGVKVWMPCRTFDYEGVMA